MRNGRYVDVTGLETWYKNDELHRDDGPALIYPDGDRYWYQNGKYHREDGPAVILNDGSKEWWVNGKRHREDGPADIWPNGTKKWYKNGKLHREDGPAIIWGDDGVLFFLDNRKVESYDEFQVLTFQSDEYIMYLKLKYGAIETE